MRNDRSTPPASSETSETDDVTAHVFIEAKDITGDTTVVHANDLVSGPDGIRTIESENPGLFRY